MPSSRLARLELIVKWALGIFVLGLCAHLIARIGFEGDTWALLRESDAALACMRRNQWVGCAEAWHFPLLQVIPSILMRLLGIENDGAIVRWLAQFSFISYWLIAIGTYRLLARKSRTIALLGILILASGYNMRYANLSFGEMLGAFMIFGMTTTIVASGGSGRLAWLTGIFAFWAAIHKDTAFPFLLLLALISTLASEKQPNWRRIGLFAGIPLTAGLVASCAYNYFKFGTWYNVANLDGAGNVVKDPIAQLNAFAALWLSPHGGVAFFWPSFFALLVVCAWITRRRARPDRLVLLGAGMILGGLTLGFSKWYAPFGWHAWGPRLFLPWIPALSFLLLYTYRDDLESALRSLSPRGIAIGAALWITLSWPQFRAVVEYQIANRVMESTSCAVPADASVLGTWLRCGAPPFWPGYANWALPTAYRIPPRPDLWLWCLIYSGFLTYGIVCLLRSSKSPSKI